MESGPIIVLVSYEDPYGTGGETPPPEPPQSWWEWLLVMLGL